MQRFFNKWVPTAFDLFGTDNSSLGALGVRVGAQGPVRRAGEPRDAADAAHLNEASRGTVSRGDLPAGGPAEPADPGAASGGSRCPSCSSTGASGPVGAPVLHRRRRADGRRRSTRPTSPSVHADQRGPASSCAASSRRPTGSSAKKSGRTDNVRPSAGHRAPRRLGLRGARTPSRPSARAGELGADAVELDIHATADGGIRRPPRPRHSGRRPAGRISLRDAFATHRLANGEPHPDARARRWPRIGGQ